MCSITADIPVEWEHLPKINSIPMTEEYGWHNLLVRNKCHNDSRIAARTRYWLGVKPNNLTAEDFSNFPEGRSLMLLFANHDLVGKSQVTARGAACLWLGEMYSSPGLSS